MKQQLLFFYVLVLLSLVSCRSDHSSYSSNNAQQRSYHSSETEEAFPDGDYCADVEYYNPNTGTQSSYTLNVEVEDNELIKIYWPNGGWLDDDHFYPEELDEDGYCEFTSDEGYEYTVQIIGDPCSFTDEDEMESDYRSEIIAHTCPNCGGKKGRYYDYCDDCTDEIENTCSNCGAYEYGIYGGLCSSCQEDEENNDW